MRLIIRTIVVVAILWIGVLLSGYGVLFHSEENVGGLGLKCQYLTARGVSTALYVHSNSGVIGVSNCPILRKSATVVDNGENHSGGRDNSTALAGCFSYRVRTGSRCIPFAQKSCAPPDAASPHTHANVLLRNVASGKRCSVRR